jgi:DtxR family transcriptional regulator, Mn-dependent transcriptional regulator
MTGLLPLEYLTPQDRETLKAICLRDKGLEPVRPGELVVDLSMSPATVTARLKRLHDMKLVNHIPYAGVTLTDQGNRMAVTIVRRHRIVERFLVDTLEYAWEEAETLAPSFEHALPAGVVQRLYEILGQPDTCPHGFPIPDQAETSVPTLKGLLDMVPGQTGEIAVPSNTAPDAIAYLGELGVRPGTFIRMIERLPFDGPVRIEVDGTEQTVGNKLARMLSVASAG